MCAKDVHEERDPTLLENLLGPLFILLAQLTDAPNDGESDGGVLLNFHQSGDLRDHTLLVKGLGAGSVPVSVQLKFSIGNRVFVIAHFYQLDVLGDIEINMRMFKESMCITQFK